MIPADPLQALLAWMIVGAFVSCLYLVLLPPDEHSFIADAPGVLVGFVILVLVLLWPITAILAVRAAWR